MGFCFVTLYLGHSDPFRTLKKRITTAECIRKINSVSNCSNVFSALQQNYKIIIQHRVHLDRSSRKDRLSRQVLSCTSHHLACFQPCHSCRPTGCCRCRCPECKSLINAICEYTIYENLNIFYFRCERDKYRPMNFQNLLLLIDFFLKY